MKKYLDMAARAWAKATLNIKKFADAYKSAIDSFGEDAQEKFSAAYPMFGAREWQRMYFVGSGVLLPQFMFKSDSFVCKLMKMKNSMEWQNALVGAAKDGTLRVDRGNGPESVSIADLTKKETDILGILMSEDDSKLSAGELINKFCSMVRTVNKNVSHKKSPPWQIKNGALKVNRACTISKEEIALISLRLGCFGYNR